MTRHPAVAAFVAAALVAGSVASPVAHAAAAHAAAAPAKSAAATPAHKAVLPFIADDLDRALAEAKRRDLPLFIESWAPW